MALVSQINRPKSVHNRCVIVYFGGFLCCYSADFKFASLIDFLYYKLILNTNSFFFLLVYIRVYDS